ncbi:MAG: hypothetical protein IJX65_04220 [Alistipes sp.]|nr:hypothetical protein [Alistipes sp.]
MKSIFSAIWDIIQRNPLTTLFIVMLAIAAPGVLGVFALFLIIPLIIVLIGMIAVAFRVRKVRKQMDDHLRDAQRRGAFHTDPGSTPPPHNAPEGKVTVHVPKQEPRVNDDVGEYVSFKEE